MSTIDSSIFNSQSAFEVFEGANVGIAIHQMVYDENGLAIDLVQRPRSTGSTLKPFLFAKTIV